MSALQVGTVDTVLNWLLKKITAVTFVFIGALNWTTNGVLTGTLFALLTGEVEMTLVWATVEQTHAIEHANARNEIRKFLPEWTLN